MLLDDIREIMFDSSVYDTTKVYDLMVAPPETIDSNENMDADDAKNSTKTGAWESASRERRKIRGICVSKSKLFSACVQKAAEGIFRSLIVWSRDPTLVSILKSVIKPRTLLFSINNIFNKIHISSNIDFPLDLSPDVHCQSSYNLIFPFSINSGFELHSPVIINSPF